MSRKTAPASHTLQQSGEDDASKPQTEDWLNHIRRRSLTSAGRGARACGGRAGSGAGGGRAARGMRGSGSGLGGFEARRADGAVGAGRAVAR